MTEPTDRDREAGRGLITQIASFDDRAEAIAQALAEAREEGRCQERKLCVDVVRELLSALDMISYGLSTDRSHYARLHRAEKEAHRFVDTIAPPTPGLIQSIC
jgi:hypothetical protein